MGRRREQDGEADTEREQHDRGQAPEDAHGPRLARRTTCGRSRRPTSALCTFDMRVANVLCSSDSCTSFPSRNSPFSNVRSYCNKPVVGLVGARELPVAPPEQPRLLGLLDGEEPAHREVDDRRRHVERVGLEVDQRADLSGAEVVGRHELDRRLVLPTERDALVTGAARRVLARRVAATRTRRRPRRPALRRSRPRKKIKREHAADEHDEQAAGDARRSPGSPGTPTRG